MNEFKLKDLIEIRNGARYYHLKDGDIPVFGSGGIMCYVNDYLYDGEVVLLPRKGTLNNIMFYSGKLWSVDTMYYAIVNEKANPYYLYSYLKLLDLKHLDSGSTLPSMTKSAYNDLIIKLPKINVQKKISDFLYDLEAKIQVNNKINSELESMAKLIYDYWFVQYDFPDESGKPYKSSGGKMVYNEELKREIPEGWKATSLLEMANFTNGIACQKYRPNDGEESYNVIKIREMTDGFTIKSELVSRSIPQKVIVNDGDILFSWSATLDVMIWSGGIGGLNQHIFKVTSEIYPRTFLYFEVLKYLEYFKMIANSRKTTMGHITRDHLKESRICIPPDFLIEKLHNKVDPLITKIVKANQENNKLAELRDWLLPMLMNGQVTVN
jgi:type I restriction enzyme S subunit